MQKMLQKWSGSIVINDVEYKNVQSAESVLKTLSDDIHIILKSANKSVSNRTTAQITDTTADTEYRITVK